MSPRPLPSALDKMQVLLVIANAVVCCLAACSTIASGMAKALPRWQSGCAMGRSSTPNTSSTVRLLLFLCPLPTPRSLSLCVLVLDRPGCARADLVDGGAVGLENAPKALLKLFDGMHCCATCV